MAATGGVAMLVALQLCGCGRSGGERPPARVADAPQPAPPPPPPPPPPFSAADASAALAVLKAAPTQGFAAARFGADAIATELDGPDPAEEARGRERLRAAVIDYARAEHGLTIPLHALPKAWNQRPSRYDAAAELDGALRSGRLQAWLDDLPPQTAQYRSLQAAYAEALSDGRETKARAPVETTDLDPGEDDERVQRLRRRLAAEGLEPADADPEDPADDALQEAVRRYQDRHDLPVTGVVDADTAARLNAPTVGRLTRLRVNLERLRWLPRPEPKSRIDVNIASAELDYIHDGEVAAHMLAVSGKLGDETPMVSSAIDSIVLNPPWHVPADIAAREILPKGAAYMKARHFTWRDGRLIQEAGAKAALGLVKFNFPNPYAVYLHDTPSKASFALAQRTASHGCVRVQHAVELAKLVAAAEPGLSAERVDTVLASGRTGWLKLSDPLPVRLMYLTAEAKDGEVVYHPDVYGWDAPLAALLDRYGGAPRAAAHAIAAKG